MQVFTSRHLLAVSSPPIKQAAVAVEDGVIVAAGPRAAVLKKAGSDCEIRDLGNVAVLPGLINAHVHLELSWMGASRPPGGDYSSWLRAFLAARSNEDQATAMAAAEEALAFMVSRGTVAIGDISNSTWVIPLIARTPLHAMAFHEVYGFPSEGITAMLEEIATRLEALHQDKDVRAAGSRLRIAPTPHAAHTTSAALLRAMAGRSTAAKAPLSIHVAESVAELSLLRDGSGPLASLFKERDFWDASWEAPQATPLEYLHRLGVLSSRSLVVHCVHVEKPDHSLLQSSEATVVTCPRSNQYLAVGNAPIAEYLREGIPVALGTDSLASAPDLDLFAEIKALRETHTSISPAAALRMATLNGARALGLDEQLGSIEPGKAAKLIAIPLAGEKDDPLLAACSCPTEVYPLEQAPWAPPGQSH